MPLPMALTFCTTASKKVAFEGLSRLPSFPYPSSVNFLSFLFLYSSMFHILLILEDFLT